MERLPVTTRPEEDAHVLAGMLAADLEGWPTDAWLVFDDYHAIGGMLAAERFVETLVARSSGQRARGHTATPWMGIVAPDSLWRGLRTRQTKRSR